MRKAIASCFMVLLTLVASVQSTTALAAGINAGGIFQNLGGTTTVEKGGVIHSQTRTIFSLGGGRTTFPGKRVNLIAADPPSFSAGCTGISWHFGGFAFISMDEIRQLVEAVAQASLGVAVDLAMQTLCPQCYAVMAKLRDIANQMRNAAADSCAIAQGLGRAAFDALGFRPAAVDQNTCATTTASAGKTEGILNSLASRACGALGGIGTALGEVSGRVNDYLNGRGFSGTTPTQEELSRSGNMTYRALTALGYPDGFGKDLMLSIMGMSIVPAKNSQDCRETFAGLRGDAASVAATEWWETRYESANKQVKASSPTQETKPSDAARAEAKTNATESRTGGVICNAPPLMEDTKNIAFGLICGFWPEKDIERYARLYYQGDIAQVKATSLGRWCSGYSAANPDKNGSPASWTTPYLYTCRTGVDADCTTPRMVRATDLLQESGDNGFTGVGWMIAAALSEGVISIRDNPSAELPKNTVRILNGSGYPLYRLLNLAAVYPMVTREVMEAYISTIAAHYVMDSMDKVVRVASQPQIDLGYAPSVDANTLSRVRADVMNAIRTGTEMRLQAMTSLNEKRAMVDVIMQLNRSLQSEVISRGLSGNGNLAVTIKEDYEKAKAAAGK